MQVPEKKFGIWKYGTEHGLNVINLSALAASQQGKGLGRYDGV